MSKPHIIKGQVQDKNNAIYNFVILVKDGLSAWRCENQGFTRRLYKKEKVFQEKRGEGDNLVLQDSKDGFLTMAQFYPGKKRDEITRIVAKELKKQKVNITK